MSSQIRPRRSLIAGAATLGLAGSALLAAPANASTEANAEVEWPDEFTSAYTAWAVPEEVVDPDTDEASPGEEGATGDFMFWVNSNEEIICYDITLEGVTGDYESPAETATHIHEAVPGEGGPPRLVFADPEPVDEGPRTSSGCIQGPFMTGTEDDDGNDEGEGFTLAQLEEDPGAFFADSHTEMHPDGVVRGQLIQVPLDGMETGGGGTVAQSSALPVAGAAAAGLAGVGAFVLLRRNRSQA